MEALKACKDSAHNAHRAVGTSVILYMTPYYTSALEINSELNTHNLASVTLLV